MYECVPDVKYIFVTLKRIEAVFPSHTHFQQYGGTWEGRMSEGKNVGGLDDFVGESNVQLKCRTVYLLEVVG
jgi:hypothetical protein